MLSAPDFSEKQILFVLLSRGESISFRNDNIIIKDKEGHIKHQSSCYKLFILFVSGHLTVTSGLLQRAKRFNFTIIFLTHGLHYYGEWAAALEGNVLLRKKQYQYNGHEIAVHLVADKIQGEINNLKNIRKQTNKIKQAIIHLKQHRESVLNIKNTSSFNEKTLLGLEGSAARTYFSHYFSEQNWTTRRPRVKHDICNSLLDIGYTLLFHFIEALLRCYGFDLYYGVYHKIYFQRKSLVCDLVEPFRILIDTTIRKSFNLKQIHEDDFLQRENKYFLNPKKSSYYSQIFLSTLLKHKIALFYYIQKYYRAFMRDNYDNLPVFSEE